MDFSKLKPNDWMIIGGALGFLIFGLVGSWASRSGFDGGNAFDWFRGWASWILVVAAGVITFLRVTDKMADGGRQWPMILVIMTGVAGILMLLLMITGPDKSGIDFGRGFALWLSFIATIVALAGSFLNFTAAGGDIKDFADVGKLKGAFDSDDDDGGDDA